MAAQCQVPRMTTLHATVEPLAVVLRRFNLDLLSLQGIALPRATLEVNRCFLRRCGRESRANTTFIKSFRHEILSE